MKQVLQTPRSGAVRVEEVPAPRLRAGGALVTLRASVISPGTERGKIELGRKGLVGKARARPDLARQVVEKARRDGVRETYAAVTRRLDTPSALGYSACGVVEQVGVGCETVAPGDLVACAGGEHATHAEVVFVPANLLAPVPAGLAPEQAAYATLGAIAMHGVRQAEVDLGSTVAVIGLGVVGLLAGQLARAAGARALAVDLDPDACKLARRVGLDRSVERDEPVEEIARAFTGGIGVDSVLVCASAATPDPLELAVELCRDRGRIVVVGAVPVTLPREQLYAKELELRMSRSYGPGRYDPVYEDHGTDYPIGYVRWTEGRNLAEFLRLVAAGSVDVEALTSHRFSIDQATEAYDLVAGRGGDGRRPVGVVLTYEPEPSALSPRVDVLPAPPHRSAGTARVGLVGAGSFATRVLLPALATDPRVELVGVASATGVSARHVAGQRGFRYATTDGEALVDDPEIDAVVVTTRHDSHAALARRGIEAGKAVFCEKPLATRWDDLDALAEAYAERPVPLLVGFNRRFAPLAAALRDALPRGLPRAVAYRVNAGPVTPEHWVHDPVAGAGRLVGEACHFLDLACFLAEQPPVAVTATPLGAGAGDDSVLVTVEFGCGSLATVHYLANGDPSGPKERLEATAGGTSAVLDDFKTLEIRRGGKRRVTRARGRDKGHRAEMRFLVDAACGTGDADLGRVAAAAFWSSALTLQAAAALRAGTRLDVELPAALRFDN
jgi:predicted dehydrogenase/threonine dehydrogenase-like Zn-dependent dehydrogenase